MFSLEPVSKEPLVAAHSVQLLQDARHPAQLLRGQDTVAAMLGVEVAEQEVGDPVPVLPQGALLQEVHLVLHGGEGGEEGSQPGQHSASGFG